VKQYFLTYVGIMRSCSLIEENDANSFFVTRYYYAIPNFDSQAIARLNFPNQPVSPSTTKT
jgi:hypothetical protein